MPGSFGVEAILQAIRAFALNQKIGKNFRATTSFDKNKCVWKYRGQISPKNSLMALEVHIKKIEPAKEKIKIIADASLWKDRVRIYEITNIAVFLISS